jgi:nitrogen fixation protein FixH
VRPFARHEMRQPGGRDGRKNGGSSGRLSGRTVLLSLVGFFTVVIGVNVTMMTLAISTMPGTEVESPYLAGIKYNAEISSARAQEARGWRMTSHVDRAGDGHAVVTIEALDRDGAPLPGLALSVSSPAPPTSAPIAHSCSANVPPGVISARQATSPPASGTWKWRRIATANACSAPETASLSIASLATSG